MIGDWGTYIARLSHESSLFVVSNANIGTTHGAARIQEDEVKALGLKFSDASINTSELHKKLEPLLYYDSQAAGAPVRVPVEPSMVDALFESKDGEWKMVRFIMWPDDIWLVLVNPERIMKDSNLAIAEPGIYRPDLGFATIHLGHAMAAITDEVKFNLLVMALDWRPGLIDSVPTVRQKLEIWLTEDFLERTDHFGEIGLELRRRYYFWQKDVEEEAELTGDAELNDKLDAYEVIWEILQGN